MNTIFEKSSLNLSFRVHLWLWVFLAFFFILLLRLWYLQIVQGDYFRERSENNRLRTLYVAPPRGLIYDRNGSVLVSNRPSFDIDLVREDSPDPKQSVKDLAALLDMESSTLVKRLGNQKRRRFEPYSILVDLPREKIAQVSAHRYRLPGVVVAVNPLRHYLYGSLGAHTLGYIREITKEQLSESQYSRYRSGDIIGQFGVEARWEQYLQGQRGERTVLVNARGMRIGEAYYEPEVSGHNVRLTIDKMVQQAADTALAGKRGGIVAMNPKTGGLYALASSPTYNPNMFTGEISAKEWRHLVAGKERPLSNRAVQGGYPPGSIFKIIMAVAGLAEGVISTKETAYCGGYHHFEGRNYHCHKRAGHGYEDLRDALVHSCDVYFYILGQRLGIDRIHQYATRFGLGERTGLKLVEEQKGLVPSRAWKKAAHKKREDQRWYRGETLSVAIGQGAVLTSPLQMARAIAALVNGGKVLRPKIVQTIETINGDVLIDNREVEVVRELDVSESILKRVMNYLHDVVHAERGTGWRARFDERSGITVAGKTGTAQVVSLSALTEENEEKFRDHAWFTAYAPSDDPEIVVSVLIENGGSGGKDAAPLAKEVLEAYFRRYQPGRFAYEQEVEVTDAAS